MRGEPKDVSRGLRAGRTGGDGVRLHGGSVRHLSRRLWPVLMLASALWLAPAVPSASAASARCSSAGAAGKAPAHRSSVRGQSATAKRKGCSKPKHPAKPKPKPKPKGPAPLRGNAAHAVALYEAMQHYFYMSGSGLYREELGTSAESFLWPYSQALAATVSVAHIANENTKLGSVLSAQLNGLERYFTTSVPAAIASSGSLESLPHYTATLASAGEGATSFYDDNDWVGIELVRLFELSHNSQALNLAAEIMTFEMDGWSSNPREPCPGGIPHSDSSSDEARSTISTAPAAELAVLLYRITGNTEYLSFAQRAYAWVRQCLLGPEGLFADHLEANGETDPELWSYTQGVMIGAGALLYQTTGAPSYLEQAEALANAAVAYFKLETLAGENPFFASVFLRNLLYLDAILHSNTGRALAQEYGNWAWENLREPDGLILSSSGTPTVLLGQSGVAQVFALLAISPSTYF